MVNELILVCSIMVFTPQGTRYISVSPCEVIKIVQTEEILRRHGIDPWKDGDCALSNLSAEIERSMRDKE